MDFNNSGALKSPFSPRVRQSISGRRPIGQSSTKNQSKFMQSSNEQTGDVIYKTPLVTVETYGLPLPVMVTEVLTLGSGDVSVRMSDCGWCWVVSGRRILAWPHSLPEDGNTSLPAGGLAARELTLPQTDLAHKADLVMVFYSEGSQMASCVGVSPEGVVRYWPSVGQEGVHWDVSCELAGQECDRLVLASGALVLATTTCTLMLIEPTTVEGRHTVVCRRLCPPSGWLGGIGRRVSHLFFGSMPAHAEAKLVGVVGVGGSRAEPHLALVAGGGVLQLWRGAELHEHTSLLDSILHGEGVTAREVCALQVRAAGPAALLLLLALGPAHNRRYAIAHINISDPARPAVRTAAVLRAWGAPGAGAAPEGGEEPRFLPLASRALFYTSKYIALASMSPSSSGVEVVCVGGEWERILGAELCAGQALVFSRRHGVLRLLCADSPRHQAHQSACGSGAGSPSVADMCDGNLSLFEIDPHEISTVTTDACGKLKTAFLFHLRRESSACSQLLDSLFPPREADADADGALAGSLLAVGEEMLDDVPAGDPRWKSRPGLATNIPLGSSAALQISAQLADKRRAFALYADFLRATGLMQRAGSLTVEGGAVVSCEAALCSLAERLAAAAALRHAHTHAHHHHYKPLLDRAVQAVVGDGSEEEESVCSALAAGALSAEDACYRRVSRVPRLLAALARATPPAAPLPHAQHVHHTATLLASVLSEMQTTRAAWGAGAGEGVPPPLGARALLPALVEFIKISVVEVSSTCPNPTLRAAAVEACSALARAALHEAAPLQRVRAAHTEYRRMRRELILAFVEEEGSGSARAIALADSFRDFELLVELCVQHDMHQLQHYIQKYENEGMAEIAYSWLAQRGGRHAALLARGGAGGAGGARLAGWLAACSGRAPLAALHALAEHRPRAAAALLADIADTDKECLGRAKTAASLGKLCLLASSGEEGEERAVRARLETRLALADHQEALPREIQLHRGLSGEIDPVLDGDQLLQMYIECDSNNLTEFEYKKALDLTDFIPDIERRDELRLRVWCACIARDTWSAGGGEGQVAGEGDQLHDKMFFRLIDLVHLMGGDLELLLPPLEDILTAPELAELASSPRFHYQLKYGYQCLHNQQHD